MTSRREAQGRIPKTTVSRALGGLSTDERRRIIGPLVIATVAQLRIFLTFERQMKRTGGTGIIPFELAGSTDKARQIVNTWGDRGRSAARKSLLLDFVFPPTYAALQALACDAAAQGLAKRGRGTLAAAGTSIAWTQLTAAIFDYAQNTALLLVLAGRDRRTPGFDHFQAENPLARMLASGWHVRLDSLRSWASWPGLPDLHEQERQLDRGPVAVLTLGRPPFRRLLVPGHQRDGRTRGHDSPGSAGGHRTGSSAAPGRNFLALAQRRRDARVRGPQDARQHLHAIQAHKRDPFRYESAFLRFRPYAVQGGWDGFNPLSETSKIDASHQ